MFDKALEKGEDKDIDPFTKVTQGFGVAGCGTGGGWCLILGFEWGLLSILIM